MKTTIEVNDLRLYAYHGVAQQERTVGNDFAVTVHLDVDLSHAMATDDLQHTISYADIIDHIRREMQTPSQLLEHVVYRLHRTLTTAYPQVTGGMIRLCKLTPPAGPVRIQSACITHRW